MSVVFGSMSYSSMKKMSTGNGSILVDLEGATGVEISFVSVLLSIRASQTFR
jgi:hypothetical protein